MSQCFNMSSQKSDGPSLGELSRKDIMQSVEDFKSAITRIRDILRGCAITGMDCMRHICLYLLARYISLARAAELGIPERFAWETVMSQLQINGGARYNFEDFYHTSGDCLVAHFDRLFGTEKFSFDLKPNHMPKHTEILKILNAIDISTIDLHMDVLGWVYEQHLGTGASDARDLGQFFTDRLICEYMVALCQPKFKADGVPESVCDPSMGTGGFLTMFMKFFKKNYSAQPVDWSVHNKEIHGCDTDTKVAGVARLNLFMESGGHRAPMLETRDSLGCDLIQPGYDIILANMPFGLKGLKYAECCERLRALNISGTKSEPLFLQLMMISLNPGGRCAVVVPDGMLVNETTCHNKTRKYLLEHFEVKRVIKMKGKFFMNTGIQPSVLFFENTGNPTTDVEFWDVVRNINGDITETMVLSVPREKINSTYSLDMQRYVEVKETPNVTGFPMVKLSDACKISKGRRCKLSVESGGYPYQDVSKISRMVETFILDSPAVLTPRVLSVGRFVYTDERCHPSDDMFILLPTPQLTAKYLYYYCTLHFEHKFKAFVHGVKPTITYSIFEHMQIVIPPLEIQQEIVATLDRIYAPGTTELSDTIRLTDRAMDLVLINPTGACLEPIIAAQRLVKQAAQMAADVRAQMAADVRAQMAAIVNASGANGTPTKLEDVCELVGGKGNYIQDGDLYPYYDSNGIKGFRKNYLYDGEYIVTARKLSIGSVHYVVGKYWPSDNTINIRVKINSNIALNRFVYYWILLNNSVLKKMSSGIKPGIRKSDVGKLILPLPSIERQQKTVEILNNLQQQLDSLELLQRQSESNARFILESYLSCSPNATEPAPIECDGDSIDKDEEETDNDEDENTEDTIKD
jgi:restriction endonuclease S subunit